MSKPQITLVEYMGISSFDGQLMGHSYKVLDEYYQLMEPFYDISIIITDNAQHAIAQKDKIKLLLHRNIIIRDNDTKFQQIKNWFIKIQNINDTLKKTESEVYWFYNIDFSLVLYMLFRKKYRGKVICNLYRRYFGKNNTIGRLKNKLADYVLKKLGIVIYTGKNFSLSWKNTLFMPDYYYIPEKYDEYQEMPKKEKAVCLGNMNQFKLLDETVEAFNNIKYPLDIVGKFYDNTWKKSLQEKAKENIQIKDAYLSDKEYLRRLSEAKFCIIPYDFKVYNQRTSGVLQECIFTRTIPVTYSWFLEQNNVKGLGVEDMRQLSLEMMEQFDWKQYHAWCNAQIVEEYNVDTIRKKMVEKIKELKREI